jgi:hypothetical protein
VYFFMVIGYPLGGGFEDYASQVIARYNDWRAVFTLARRRPRPDSHRVFPVPESVLADPQAAGRC